MANQKHLDLLKQGVEVWNKWREEYPETKPDLSEMKFNDVNLARINFSKTDFRHAQLSKIDLRYAFFTEANLSEANLNGADLSYADFIDANMRAADLRNAKAIAAEMWNAGLREADLRGANFNRAELYRVDLWRSNLSGANLNEASLDGADLSNADLSEANLRNASFSNADLSGANLSYADLQSANLTGAKLINTGLMHTNFSEVSIGQTVFGNIDFRSAKGLETIKHQAPSILSFDTVSRSQGNIPDVFLRGAGLTDAQINYVHSLVDNTIVYYTCFISYSSHDQDFAERLYTDLQNAGVRCWFALEDLKIGDHYYQRIEESIRLYDKLILILSNQAVQSAWVEREVVAAREREDREHREVLFPLRLDDTVMDTTKAWAADVRRRWHIGDFIQWKDHAAYQQAFERLLRNLKAEK